MLRALTLDFWGTLYTGVSGRQQRLGLLDQALRQAGCPRTWEQLEGAYEHAWQAFEQVWRQENRPFSVAEWLGEMLTFLEAELPEEVRHGLYRPLEEALLECPPRPVPGVLEVLPRLARRFRLGIVSDVGLTPGRVLREFLQRDGLLPHFQALTFSDEAGRTKPRPEVFWRTLEALGARPEEAAHIGDLPETDLAGARKAGMRAILFLGVSRREDGREWADAVFTDYGELEGVLEGM
ncbi:MAG: HAD family hydrolase [Chloroflexia bacterium]